MNGVNKMRCIACDKNLTDFESTRKNHKTGEFLDLCNTCFNHVNLSDIDEREDLRHVDDEE
mgnify:CR=1 FL=1